MSGLSDVAVLVTLSISRYGEVKVDQEKSKELAEREGADARWVKATKRLLPESFTHRLTKLTRSVRDYLKSVSFPHVVRGTVVIPITLLPEVQEMLGASKDRFYALVEEGRQTLQDARDDAQRHLQGMFKDDDYPDPDEWASRFKFSWELDEITSCVISDTFRAALGNDIEEHERRLEERNKATMARAQQDLVRRVRTAVGNLVEKCSKPSNETKLMPSLVENVNQLIDILPALNLAGDEGLDEVAAEMRRSLNGLSLEIIKAVPGERERAADGGKKVLDALDAWGL